MSDHTVHSQEREQQSERRAQSSETLREDSCQYGKTTCDKLERDHVAVADISEVHHEMVDSTVDHPPALFSLGIKVGLVPVHSWNRTITWR